MVSSPGALLAVTEHITRLNTQIYLHQCEHDGRVVHIREGTIIFIEANL